ncbi:MAG: DUF3619 family protein [Spongiibacteraceae bacterium]
MNPVNNVNHKPRSPEDATLITAPTTIESDLTNAIATTLKRSGAHLDTTITTQLAAARQQALTTAQPKPMQSKLAIAASVLAIAVTPWLLSIDSNTGSNTNTMDNDSLSYLSVDPEMLDTMEMLSVLGESDYAL